MPLTKDTLEKYKVGDIFFETGVGKGDGVLKALSAGYKKIISIEVAKQHIRVATERFKDKVEDGIVDIILGDSSVLLPELIKEINEPITFWLDAHWDFGPGRGKVVCPLYEELQAIKNHPIKTHLIMIDDMRIIGTDHHWGKTVKRDKLLELIKEINPDYKIDYTDGDISKIDQPEKIVQNDILVAHL